MGVGGVLARHAAAQVGLVSATSFAAAGVTAERTCVKFTRASGLVCRRVSALLAPPELLKKVSPGIVTAHLYDVLCDEARQYASRLEAAGRLHALRELPYSHGSALGFGAIMREVAQLMEGRLADVASAAK